MKLLLPLLFFAFCITAQAQYIDTKYEYPVAAGDTLFFENSLPKGGIRYTAPSGKEFIYAIFWTRVTNSTGASLELKMEFPSEAYHLPGSFDNSVKLLLPPFELSPEKEKMFNYGLEELETYFDSDYNKKSSRSLSIEPGGSCVFYVAALYSEGVAGRLRAGLFLKEEQLFYKISGREVLIGELRGITELSLD
jgi:hypothetical protein